ncbi:hypothetical protein ALTERO38_50698 [Alteromonas sp. 38]|uniref:hypothetical protein n=1 Tax=Alteromonas TaxID=226 RepID=UPI0012F28CF0|nr:MULTISPECIES: hypothetical protein [Alteromonas]CAD5284082.1 hypothetical protein ALTER154_80567 [Alteromonas sp. 154]VXB44277.1 hypothetical protein ALTERO38_50698 [Alteromonas sp. 38]
MLDEGEVNKQASVRRYADKETSNIEVLDFVHSFIVTLNDLMSSWLSSIVDNIVGNFF